MRTYVGRFLKQSAERNIRSGRELRDAVVIEVFSTLHYCTCKIQGSNQLIKAHYNENWEAYPKWLKPGNAIRLSTPGGSVKGRVEVVGHGLVIPTPIPGGSIVPIVPNPPDAVLTGGELVADGTGMTVIVQIGTYRIADTIYILGPIKMDAPLLQMDRAAAKIDKTAGIVAFDNLSIGKFRMDLVVIGSHDEVIDVVKGVESTGEPAEPAVPDSHVLLGKVFFNPSIADDTSPNYRIIIAADIDAPWTEPYASSLKITGDLELDWGTETTVLNIKVVNQYGTVVPGTYFLTVAKSYGGGTLSPAFGTPITFYGETNVTYTRDGYPPGDDPYAVSTIILLSETATQLNLGTTIILYDDQSDPQPMW